MAHAIVISTWSPRTTRPAPSPLHPPLPAPTIVKLDLAALLLIVQTDLALLSPSSFSPLSSSSILPFSASFRCDQNAVNSHSHSHSTSSRSTYFKTEDDSSRLQEIAFGTSCNMDHLSESWHP